MATAIMMHLIKMRFRKWEYIFLLIAIISDSWLVFYIIKEIMKVC